MNFGNIYGGGEDASKADNIGEEQIMNLLNQLEVPYKYSMAQKLDELREEVNIVEKHTKFLVEKVRNVQNCQRALQQAQDQMKQGFEGWNDVERLHLKSLGGKAFNEYENVLKPHEQTVSSFTNLGLFLEARGDCEKHSADYIGLTLIATLEHQLSVVESFRELFSYHDALVNSIDQLNNKINRFESGTAIMSFMNSSTKNAEEIIESKRMVQDRNVQLNLFYKGLVYFTVPLLARMRAGTLRRLNAVYASCAMSESYNGYKACVEYFRRCGLSAAMVSDVAHRMCEVLSLKPVPKLSPAVYDGEGLASEVEAFANNDTWIYENMGFLSRDTEGMRGLFERAVMISKSKAPTSSGGVAADRPVSTHLFTSTINANTSMATVAQTPPTSPNPAGFDKGSNPLSAKRSTAVRPKSQGISSPLSPSNNEEEGSANGEDARPSGDDYHEDEAYDDFDPDSPLPTGDGSSDIKSLNLPFRPSAFTFESAYAVGPEVADIDIDDFGSKKETVFGGEKAASLLDSLLGGTPSPAKKATPAPAPAPAVPVTPPPPVPSNPPPVPEPEPQPEAQPEPAPEPEPEPQPETQPEPAPEAEATNEENLETIET